MSNERSIEVVRTVDALRTRLAEWRRDGARIGLVPTMGALHDGHYSLVERAVSEADQVCTTLFVNPKQFGPNEDFERYPRNEDEDAVALQQRGVTLLYAPDVAAIYPEDFATVVTVPGIGDRLEGAFRPGFFAGVATVVTKLLLQTMPDLAYFGEKDFQQLCIIRRVVADLNIPVEICGCPTIREADGLALSSRNEYLTPEQRTIAPALYGALKELRDQLGAEMNSAVASSAVQERLIDAGFDKIDYLSAYDVSNFEEVEAPNANSHLLAAAWLGQTRLIDNIPYLSE